jgi:hypothetical protein
MIYHWPESSKFPSIDLLRLVVLQSAAPITFQKDVLDTLVPWLRCTPQNKAQETISMLVMRVFCNAFAVSEYIPSIDRLKTDVLTQVSNLAAFSHNKNLQTALANLLLKYGSLTLVLPFITIKDPRITLGWSCSKLQ